MISFEETKRLLKLPKLVNEQDNQGVLKKDIIFETTIPIDKRYVLIVPDNDEVSFLYEISQSAKNIFKLSLFLMHNHSKIGLSRVDFNGKHKNPVGVNENVPDEFKEYAGLWFDYNQPHIHYNIDGYEPMSWALPLNKNDFEIMNVQNQNDVVSAVLEFNALINLQTRFSTGSKFLI